jgi:hypothetical protein
MVTGQHRRRSMPLLHSDAERSSLKMPSSDSIDELDRGRFEVGSINHELSSTSARQYVADCWKGCDIECVIVWERMQHRTMTEGMRCVVIEKEWAQAKKRWSVANKSKNRLIFSKGCIRKEPLLAEQTNPRLT